MFRIYHNTPFNTLSITESDAEELRDTLQTALNDLERLAKTDWNDTAHTTIEDLDSIIQNLEEHLPSDPQTD